MTCDEFENLLQEVLDRRETPSADPFLIPHAKVCDACQRKVALYEALFDGLELAETPVLGSDFSSKTSRAATVRRKRNWQRAVGILAAMAASLLLAVAFFNRDRGGQQPPTINRVAENDGEATPSQNNATDQRQRRERDNRRPLPMVAVGHSNAGHAGGQQADSEAELAAADLEIFLQEIRHASENMSLAETSAATARLPGVRPLTSSLGTAVSAIRQTLPGGRGEESQRPKPQARVLPGGGGRYV